MSTLEHGDDSGYFAAQKNHELARLGALATKLEAELEARDRQILQYEIALKTIRSHLRDLPRTATANRIDEICADALGEARTP